MESRRFRTGQKNILLSCTKTPRLHARSRLYKFGVLSLVLFNGVYISHICVMFVQYRFTLHCFSCCLRLFLYLFHHVFSISLRVITDYVHSGLQYK